MFSIFRRPSRSLLKGTINALNENLSDRNATIDGLRLAIARQQGEAEDARVLAANYTAASFDGFRKEIAKLQDELVALRASATAEIKILERQVDTMIDASRLAIEILS